MGGALIGIIKEIIIMEKIKEVLKAVWKFISYLFWPQKTDKTRYDS